MGFLETGLAANDGRFQTRVQACLYKLAQDVRNEAPETDNHEARVALANGVIDGSTSALPRFVWLCAANPTIAATITEVEPGRVEVAAPDSDLEYVCASNWDVLSPAVAPAPPEQP